MQCVILLLEKKTSGHDPNVKTKIIDFRKDGYEIKRVSKYKQIYGRGYGWNTERIRNDIISLPVVIGTNDIAHEWIRRLYD